MNIFFRLSLSSSLRSSHTHYFTFISDDVEKKKNTEAEEDRQHVSSSIEEETKKNIFISSDKITALSMSNNFQKLEKESNESSESSENRILLSTSETFNSVELTSKATSKRSYNLKSFLSKFDKQTKSTKESENRFNYKDLHREHMIKSKKKRICITSLKLFVWTII